MEGESRARGWRLRICGLGILSIFGAIWIVQLVCLGNHLEAQFALVSKGEPRDRVKALLGTPSRVTGPPRYVTWDSQDTSRLNNGTCVQEIFGILARCQSRARCG